LSLDLGETYYWKINEVNDAETTTTRQGDIWNFSTQEFFVVEDFENYNDFPPDEIWFTWVDGYGVPANGATVGYPAPVWNLDEHYAETATVHGGDQSMPFFYNNTGTATYSEGERTFAVPQNWTEAGVQTLVLYFHGSPGNTGQLYVKVNGSKVVYDGDAGDIVRPRWKAWNIDLASFGTDLQGVTTVGIGMDGNGATGTMYVDDIRLYRTVPEPPEEIFFEAEAAETITLPMQVYDDPAASGGQYIAVAPDNSSSDAPPAEGVATYSVTVQGGVYKIIGRAFAADGSNDSFWLRILDSTGQIVPTNTTNHSSGWVMWNGIMELEDDNVEWHWEDVFSDDDSDLTVHFTMAAGTYTLEIAYRDGCKLDAFVITDKLD
jgi:hypothetical protein